MPTCTSCGAELAPGSRYCSLCGAASGAGPAAGGPAGAAIRAAVPAPSLTATSPSTPPTPAPHAPFDPGTRLGPRYRIVAFLGRGGMGEVYRADDLELHQPVALKFLPGHVHATSIELDQLRREVRVAREIAHPNVCRTYDIASVDGHVFLVMEYIGGEDLASVLRRLGRPSRDKAVEIARQLCLGLGAAHERGILHRDLKPANVMIDDRGIVRITDFGLAGLEQDVASAGGGTPAYMAPEQLAAGSASVQSDLYSLGLVLYEVFTGKRAYDGRGAAAKRPSDSSPRPPSSVAPDIDPAVERVVMRCLDSDPRSRPASAYAVLGALPGGDPLAAALAAGETPSPELVASAGVEGTVHPGVAFACVALAVASLIGLAAADRNQLAGLHRSDAELALRSGEILREAGIVRPAYSYGGFMENTIYFARVEGRDSSALAYSAAHPELSAGVLYWRRFSPTPLTHPDMHNPTPNAMEPMPGPGSALVLLDPDGRLVHLSSMPVIADEPPRAKTERVPPPVTDWPDFVSRAGYDVSRMTPMFPGALEIAADSVSASIVPGLTPRDGPIALFASWRSGRVDRFWIDAPWGTSRDPFAFETSIKVSGSDRWFTLAFFTIIPILAVVLFAVRNLRAGRGDRRGALRFALYTFFVYLLAHAVALNIFELGPGAALETLLRQAPMGHALLHATIVWFLYMALEPYLRRLWPRVLVSWARLVSGRLRDPMIGRDILVGFAFVAFNLTVLLTTRAIIGPPPGPERFAGVVIDCLSGLRLAIAGLTMSVASVPQLVMALFTILLIFRVVSRRNWVAIVGAALFFGAFFFLGTASSQGPLAAAITSGATVAAFTFIALRFGFLAALVSGLLAQTVGNIPWTTDLSAWYSSRMLIAVALFGPMMIYGFVIALGGRSIFRDPIAEAG
jgi:eukaryotic-like serine/threonine-protein kinase